MGSSRRPTSTVRSQKWGDVAADIPPALRQRARQEQERRARLKGQKERCEEDLLYFGMTFWHVLEPRTPLGVGWVLRALCDLLMAVTDGHHQRVIINLIPGSGKALADDTPIFTTWGWKRHGDLQPGDYVYGPDGRPKMVQGCTPSTIQPLHDVCFDDGATLRASGEHLWAVERDIVEKGWRRRERRTVSTTDLRLSDRGPEGKGCGPDRIAATNAVLLPPRRLLIDPYTLGAWLGDGTSIAAELCVGEEDIEHFGHLGRAALRKVATETTGAVYRVGLSQIYGLLRAMDLLGNKHIPADYLEASIEQRLAVFQGMMDTDGTCSAEGNCSYTTKLPGLADDFIQLGTSLGLKMSRRSTYKKLNGVKHGPYQVVSFTPHLGFEPFRLARKQARIKGNQNGRSRHRYISAVRPVSDGLAKCIQVEGGLYLAGRQFVPTHNSLWLNVIWPAWEWGPQDMPHLRYLSASYSQGLPERDNAKFSRLINSPEYQQLWGDRVDLVADGKELVENKRTGWKRVTSTRSGTTGHRGDRVLIDDANDPMNVESDSVRLATVRWLTEIMPDRLTSLDTGVVVNLQQRTHEEDATGTLAKPDHWGDDCVWMMIPMRFDPLRATPVVIRTDDDGRPTQVWRDPRGLDADGNELEGLYNDLNTGALKVRMGSPMARADGSLCWPERFSEEQAVKMQSIKGPFAWAGQYQQAPTVRGGGVIRRDWWQLWPEAEFPPLGTVVGSLDTSIKEGESNDYNAFTSWGAFALKDSAPKLILTSAWTARMSIAELIRRTAESCYDTKVDYLLIEDKARGHDVAAEIVRQYEDAPWETILIPVNGAGAFSGDKRARLEAVSVMFSGDVRRVPMPGDPERQMEVWSGGMIFEPGREWSQEVIDQVAAFPSGAHDDLCDSTSMALSWIRRHGVVVRQAEWDREEYQRKLYKRRPTVPYAIT